MKKLTSLIAGAFVLLAALAPVAIVAVPAMSLTACKTTSGKSLTTLAEKVTEQRIVWSDWVHAQKARNATLPAGSEQNAATLALSAKERVVKAALDSYQDAQRAAEASVDGLPKGSKVPKPLVDKLSATGAAYLSAVKSQLN